jgi:hypothetical protein
MADNVSDLRAWRPQSGEPPLLTDWQRFVCLFGGVVFVCVGVPLAVLLGWAVANIGRPGGAPALALLGLVPGLGARCLVHGVGIGARGEGWYLAVVEAVGEQGLATTDEEELAIGGEAAHLVGEEEGTTGLAGLLGGALLGPTVRRDPRIEILGLIADRSSQANEGRSASLGTELIEGAG